MKGTIVVIVTAKGHVAAAETDFEQSRPGGYSLDAAQELRARERAWRRVMREFCHEDIAAAICEGGVALSSVANRLLGAGDWTQHVERVDVGSDGEVESGHEGAVR